MKSYKEYLKLCNNSFKEEARKVHKRAMIFSIIIVVAIALAFVFVNYFC